MSNEMHVLDWLPAYALGSLDQEEKAQVEIHLRSCDLCQRELQAYQAVVEELPLAAPQREPPPGLRQAIMARANSNAMRTPAVPERKPSFWEQLRRSFSKPVPTWGLVGALVVVVALIAINVMLLQRVAAAPGNDFRVVDMNSTAYAPGADAWIVMSNDGRAGTLITEWLPPFKANQQYQLWLIKDGQRTNGGVFSVDSWGYASLWVDTKEPLADYQQFGVTVEPLGGSPAPTGEKVLGGSQ